MATVSCPKQSQFVYRPRKPEKTPLFQVIKKHFTTWCRNSKNPIPGYVSKEFNSFLGCGILAKGFACAHCDGCHKDFLIAFSCKGRGICPSCNTRAMVETAANLIENVIPRVPIRQFVISFPMRKRHYLQTHTILQDVLHIVVDEIRKKLIACSPDVLKVIIGAVSFIQHFGNSLNLHPHFHLLFADGIFNVEGSELRFFEAYLTQDDIADILDSIRSRMLKFFCKRGWFDEETVEKMLHYENSGFSLDAKVRIEAWDRIGLERLIRYCARPSFASENLWWNGSWLVYRFPKPSYTGQTFIQLEPLEFLERIAAFIPYPRRHRRHYHGVFAPNSPLRKKVVASRHLKQEVSSMQESAEKVEKVSFNWAKLIARIYEVNPLTCTTCGKEIRIISFVTHREAIWRILKGIGWPTEVPEFDPIYEISRVYENICQLVPGTKDGFPEDEEQRSFDIGPDPPFQDNYYDPPHCEDNIDLPHWED